jgi:hypothetical protein
MATVEELEARLAAAKKAREAAAEQRAAARAQDPRRIEAEIARIERATADDAKFAELVEEYGDGALRRLNTPRDGMVVVKAAPPLVHRRFVDESGRADHANPKVRTSLHDAAERLVAHCLVYPDRDTFAKMAERVPALVLACANEAYDLGRPQVEEDAGK